LIHKPLIQRVVKFGGSKKPESQNGPARIMIARNTRQETGLAVVLESLRFLSMIVH